MIANFEVATGKILSPTLGQTRTEADFAAHIEATIKTGPDARWIFVADQLDTHRICLVYTRRHCSWLNQVEIWFSILAR